MGFNRSIPIADERTKIMKLPEGPRSPQGTKTGGLSKKAQQMKSGTGKGIQKRGPAGTAEANWTQKTEVNPFEQPPINSIPKWKAGMKKPRGNNPPKQNKTRMSGRGGRTPGSPSSLGRL
jgi:hypothetical protein